MSTGANAGVPGIPLGALDAIADENTRQVLQAVVDGLNVRNGFSGSKENRFISASELDRMATSGSLNLLIRKAAQQAAANYQTGTSLSPGEISRALSDLHTQVFESKLFHDLEARVDLIDKPGGIFDRIATAEVTLAHETEQRVSGDTGLSLRLDLMGTRVGNAETAIATETTQRVNADNAIQQTITTQYASVNSNLSLLQNSQTTTANNVAALAATVQQVQAQVDNNAVAIQQETQARASADGTLYAQYTLRVDVNGRVSGFGLAADANVSDFIVRADRFSIVNPNGNYAALIMTNNTINVYDENGVLRVRMGRLS